MILLHRIRVYWRVWRSSENVQHWQWLRWFVTG